jgi:hypothetical protein
MTSDVLTTRALNRATLARQAAFGPATVEVRFA